MFQGRRHQGGRGGIPPPPLFFRSKEKIGKKRKKRRVSKQKLLKGCHQGQNVTVLAILERLEFKNFSCRPTMVADIPFQCSMAPPLWNPFRRPCVCHEIIWKKDLLLWFKFTICPVLGVILVHSIYFTCPLDYDKVNISRDKVLILISFWVTTHWLKSWN